MTKKNYIIGSGISAASFCYFGREFENNIFEKEMTINGRIKSYHINNYTIEIGAQFFCKEDKNIYNLVKEMNFHNNLQKINLQDFTLLHNDNLIKLKNKISDKLLREERDELNSFYSFLKTEALESFKNPSEDFFTMHFDEWYKKNIGNSANWLIMGLIRAITFSEPSELAALYGLLVCSTFFEPCYTINGGLELLNKKLLSCSKPKIMKNTEVTELMVDGNVINELKLNNNKRIKISKKDNIISTITTKELVKLLPDILLKKQLEKIKYNGCGVTLIKTKKHLLNHGAGIICTKNNGISIIIDEPKYLGFNSKKGYILILTPYKEGEKDIFKKTINEAKILIPKFEDYTEKMEFFKWDYGLPIASPELFYLQKKIFNHDFKNLNICGDFMGMPSLDACIESSQIIVNKIMI